MTSSVELTSTDAVELAAAFMAGLGTPADMAREIAEHLVDADLVGHGSHGISRLPSYAKYVDDKQVVAGARPQVLTGTTSPTVSAEWGFSHVAARMTTDLACERARSGGLGLAGLVRSTHVGRLGAYIERAAAADCIAMAFVGGMGGSRLVAPFGGRSGLLSTNPIAAGFPTASGKPLVIDFSTAAAPIGKIMVAALEGRRMPTESLVDADGRPSNDPTLLERGGSMRTFGDHKGFGLAVLVELLGRVLLGSERFGDGGGPIFERQGLLILTVAADSFRGLSDVLAEAEQLRDDIHAVAPAEGFDQVLAPGDPEQRARERSGDRVVISEGAWNAIQDAATRAGVADRIPQPLLPN
ncbi:Malate dehydrogenase [Rhodococcus wratislaviensis]|uniref:Malate dehydrogenase n=1 Tax=Rhodococcus wratislaviensis TaxID=44752 RepID=A0A402C5X2_RHOWR|nr:Ldh family oxidoreductase [Rhodococcus wratislaviensis]GCE39020.1 Malate dehydrogenase [Rhodococcus wratislaviensis]